MNQERAEQLALDFIAKHAGRKLKLIGSRKWPKRPHEWNVLFETVDRDGGRVDGPTVVIVHEETESVRYFESE
jgi:hypothetical protein